MLAKRIIPCLDIDGGRVVKGVEFVGLEDVGDPVDLAVQYDTEGADELVFLDISATYESRKTRLDLVSKISRHIRIPFTIGGGITSLDDIYAVLRAGADKVSLNSAAIDKPQLITRASQAYGSQCIVVAIDAKKFGSCWHVYTQGGRYDTKRCALEWAKTVVALGAGEILLTSIDADGGRSGYDIELTRRVTQSVSVPVIASGGAGKITDFSSAILDGGADACLAASLFHRKVICINDIKIHLALLHIPVRP